MVVLKTNLNYICTVLQKMVLEVGAWYKQCKILERYFPYLWQFTGVNECICLKLDLSVSILKILWSQVMNNSVVSEICDFLGGNAGNLWVLWILNEFTAWSHELKWRCRILFPSVTGKVRNLWRIYMLLCKNGQFWSASQTHLEV